MRTENTRLKATSTTRHQNPEGRPEIIWLRALLHIRRIPCCFHREGADESIRDFSGGGAIFAFFELHRSKVQVGNSLKGNKISTLIDNSALQSLWK